jgi:hypothetical protein
MISLGEDPKSFDVRNRKSTTVIENDLYGKKLEDYVLIL